MKTFFVAAVAVFGVYAFPFKAAAQDAIVQEGEFGIGLGAAHYFGDLNTRAHLNRPKIAGTIFFRKNFSNYISARIAATYARVGYSDVYNSDNEYMYRRNLSFNSNVWELALLGDFNFFRFMPGEPGFNFTPYITLGIGAFSYDPFAYLNGEKVYLRPLGTEGQGSPQYPDRKQYSLTQLEVPMGFGVKYYVRENLYVGIEILHRQTFTDYLDNTSTTYISPDLFDKYLSPTQALQAKQLMYREKFYDPTINRPYVDQQRGDPKDKDAYFSTFIKIGWRLGQWNPALRQLRCPVYY